MESDVRYRGQGIIHGVIHLQFEDIDVFLVFIATLARPRTLFASVSTISLLGYKKSGIKSDAAICLLRLMTQLSEVGEIGGS